MDSNQRLNQSHEAEPGSVLLPPVQVGNRNRDRNTDRVVALIFGVALVLSLLIFFVNVPRGHFDLTDKVLDSEGRVCGVDEVVKNHPYLYMVKFSENFKSVCVSECPRFDYNQIYFNSTGLNKTVTQPLYFESLDQSNNVLMYIENTEDNLFDYDEYVSQGKYNKNQFENYLIRQKLDCVPNLDISTCQHNKAKGMFHYDSRLIDNRICVPVTERVRHNATILTDISPQEPFEIGDGKWTVLFCIGSGIVLCIIFGSTVSCCMTCLLWTSIVIGGICSAVLGWFLMILGLQGSNPYISPVLETMSKEPFVVGRVAGYIKGQLMLLFLSGLALIVIAIGMPINAIVRHRAVRNSALLIESGHSMIVRRPHLIIISVFGFITTLLGVIYLYIGDYGIFFSGDLIRDPIVGHPFAQFNYPIYKKFQMWVFVLISIWFILSTACLMDWITTDAAILDYFNKSEKPVQQAIKNAFSHLGSICLGGAIFVPLAIIRILCAPFYLLFTIPGSHPLWIKIKRIACWNNWYYKYILRLNEQAFAIQALTGDDLVPSAKLFHHLEARHDQKVPYSYTIIFGFAIAGVFFVTAVNGWIAHLILAKGWLGSKNLNHHGSTLHLIFLFTLIQSSVFMRLLYSAALGIGGAFYFQLDRKENVTHDVMKHVSHPEKDNRYQPLTDLNQPKV
jgi:hypothetical protein